MATDLRSDSVTTGNTGAGFAHQLLFYRNSEEFLATAVPFLRDGLVEGDALLVVTHETNIRMLRDFLGGDADRVDFADTLGWYRDSAQTLAAYRNYVNRHSGQRVRIIGEVDWRGRSHSDVASWTHYEATCNSVFADSLVWCVCAYDVRGLSSEIIANALRTHPEHAIGMTRFPNRTYTAVSEASAAYRREDLLDEPASVHAVTAGNHDLAELPHHIAEHALHAGIAPHRTAELIFLVNQAAHHAVERGGDRATLRLWCEGELVVCVIGEVTSPPVNGSPLVRCLRRLTKRWSASAEERPAGRRTGWDNWDLPG